MERAVVDRVVDGIHAVLLVGDAETEVVVPLARLPDGAREGTWLRVRFDGPALAEARLDPDETERARARIAAKLERLRRRGRRSPGS